MLILYYETHPGKDGEVKVLLLGELQKLVAKLRAVAQAVGAAEFLVPPSLRLAVRWTLGIHAAAYGILAVAFIPILIEFVSHLIVDVHGLGDTVVLFLLRSPRLHEIVDTDIRTIYVQQILHGVHEVESLAFLDEIDDIAFLSAAKALVAVQGCIQHEGWRVLVVKYATAFLTRLSRWLQCDAGVHVKHESANVNP